MKDGNLVTDRQRNTMTKEKLDCRLEYTLSYKLVSHDSEEKEYIGTLRCLQADLLWHHVHLLD